MFDNKRYVYIWCLFSDSGFYGESDVELVKLFISLDQLLEYKKKVEKNGYLFYRKYRLYL